MRTPIMAPERGIEVAQAAQASGAGVRATAQAFEDVSGAAGRFAGAFDQIAEQQAGVYAAKAVADAKAQWTKTFIERQNEAEGDAAGFTEAMQRDFADFANQATGMAPPRAKSRMEVAFAEYGSRLAGDAMAFEATKRVSHRADMILATIDQNRNTALSDPSQFDELLDDTLMAIEDSGIPEDKRSDLATAAKQGLARSALQGLIETNPAEAFAGLNAGRWDSVIDPEDKGRLLSTAKAAADGEYIALRGSEISQGMELGAVGDAAQLVRGFEGFRSGAYYDVNAHRVGYGSDTITKADGTVEKVTPETFVTREDAERDLARRVREFRNDAREKIGQAEWAALPKPAQDALTSIAYNYGSVPDRLLDAARSGDTIALAEAVDSLAADNKGINRKRRAREAEIIRRSDPKAVLLNALAGENDPVMRDRIRREAVAQYALSEHDRARAEATADIARRQRVAALEVNLDRGQASYADIEEAYAAGDVTPDQWSVLTRRKDAAVAKAAKETEGLYAAAERLQSGQPFNVFAKEDRDAVDLLYDASDKTPEAAIALSLKTGIAPSAFVADLRKGLKQGDAETFVTASQVMSQSPLAFDREGGGDVRKSVEEFNAFLSIGYEPDQAARRVNRSPEERAANEAMLPRINRELAKMDEGDAADNFAGWLPFSTPDVTGLQTPYLLGDFQSLYRDARLNGLDEEEAKSVAGERLKRMWGETSLGGSTRLMRHPPERYYPSMDGHDWIAEQAKADLVAMGYEAESVELLADAVTDSDIKAGIPPRYRMFFAKDGVMETVPGYFRADPSEPRRKTSERRREAFDALRAKRGTETMAPAP